MIFLSKIPCQNFIFLAIFTNIDREVFTLLVAVISMSDLLPKLNIHRFSEWDYNLTRVWLRGMKVDRKCLQFMYSTAGIFW
jgi:ABC-type transport system involved in Fe-S cluster assembly fused permease/ATPase subunit